MKREPTARKVFLVLIMQVKYVHVQTLISILSSLKMLTTKTMSMSNRTKSHRPSKRHELFEGQWQKRRFDVRI